MMLDLTPVVGPNGTRYSPVGVATDGLVATITYRGRLYKDFSWRLVERVTDNEEFLAQGRHMENAQEKKRLNRLPYLRDRRKMREIFIQSMGVS